MSTKTKIEDIENSVLVEAFETISGDRQDAYGAPEDSFQIIASFWSIYLMHAGKINVDLQPPLSTLDISHMMALFKIARTLGQKPTRDNYVDAIGYLAIAADRLS